MSRGGRWRLRACLRKECRRLQSWPTADELFLESAGMDKTEADIRTINEPFSVTLHGEAAQVEVSIFVQLVNFRTYLSLFNY